jgi:hypothetical protein
VLLVSDNDADCKASFLEVQQSLAKSGGFPVPNREWEVAKSTGFPLLLFG